MAFLKDKREKKENEDFNTFQNTQVNFQGKEHDLNIHHFEKNKNS